MHKKIIYQIFVFRKLRKKGMRGYMTVEAGFVIPWVIFLFVFLIYASFYLYDKCVLFQDAYTVCFRGSIQKEADGPSVYINAHMKEQFGEKYFGTDGVRTSFKREGQEVIVSGTLAEEHGWRIQTEARAHIMNPTKLIRRCRLAQKALNQLH